jgi:hypothetical protein
MSKLERELLCEIIRNARLGDFTTGYGEIPAAGISDKLGSSLSLELKDAKIFVTGSRIKYADKIEIDLNDPKSLDNLRKTVGEIFARGALVGLLTPLLQEISYEDLLCLYKKYYSSIPDSSTRKMLIDKVIAGDTCAFLQEEKK